MKTALALHGYRNLTASLVRKALAGLLGLCGFLLLIGISLSNSIFVSRPLTAAQIAQGVQAAQADTKDVIVILRDQMDNVPLVRGAHQARVDALAASQNSYVSQLQAKRSRKVVKFRTINAFATNVSKAEADQLSADPGVRAVVPDAVIRMKPSRRNRLMAASTANAANITPTPKTSVVCGTLEPEALQLTNTAFLDLSKPQAQRVRDGNGQFVTGKGVKVAYVADGLDTTIPAFTRPDGTSVFIDYQDFSGDPAGTPTGGGEAFGDASSIAAQDMPNNTLLTFDISQFVNPAHALPSPCDIRIRGMAPGASLVGLKAYSNLGYSAASTFVQAIEYAVVTDAVDVLYEAIAFNPFFDMENDPIQLANDMAVTAGVTVVAASGDAGSAGTLGSPSTDPDVISTGASTQFRWYAQTGNGVQPLANGYGYVSNNIAAFSSGGFAQLAPRTVDVVAPGDAGWALCSTNQFLYQDCDNLNLSPSPIQAFGGTSESAPLVAGEAALIIQAYRSTHHNADPSPALVKNIIMSTATDLAAPADEQGAGLINALAAVQAALSVADGHGTPSRQGNELLIMPQSAPIVAAPNTRETEVFTITNTGSTTQHLAPKLQMLGSAVAGATHKLTLDPATDPTFVDAVGGQIAYITRKFTVPSGAQHLDAAIAWQNPIGGSTIAFLGLLDPSGREVAYSDPSGAGSAYGYVDVVAPAAGTWTAVITTHPPEYVPYSYAGPVQFTWSAERFVDFGSVSPGSINLAPGASASVRANFTMPSQPGDTAAALRFTSTSTNSVANLPEVPVTLRTLIPLGPTGGSFTGTLTGGNGRYGAGPTQTFEFDVPGVATSNSNGPNDGSTGPSNMSLNLHIADDGYALEGLLVDPQGMQLSVQGNVDANGVYQDALQQFRDHPQPGRWHFVLLQNYYSSGNQTSLPFTAHIGFNTVQYSASQVPNNRNYRISASGGPVTIPISITNNGALTEWYFADARLATLAIEQLPTNVGSATQTLPGAYTYTFLPPEAANATFVAQSSVPITMDAYNDVGYGVGNTGSPDVYSHSIGNNAVAASLSAPEVPWGYWYIFPSPIGPYGPSGAPTEPVQTYASVLMKPFDPTIIGDSGDVWLDLTFGTNTFNPLVLVPGQTGTINLTITPDPSQVGQTVTGFIYLDTFNSTVYTGDEVARIPYTYTVSH